MICRIFNFILFAMFTWWVIGTLTKDKPLTVQDYTFLGMLAMSSAPGIWVLNKFFEWTDRD